MHLLKSAEKMKLVLVFIISVYSGSLLSSLVDWTAYYSNVYGRALWSRYALHYTSWAPPFLSTTPITLFTHQCMLQYHSANQESLTKRNTAFRLLFNLLYQDLATNNTNNPLVPLSEKRALLYLIGYFLPRWSYQLWNRWYPYYAHQLVYSYKNTLIIRKRDIGWCFISLFEYIYWAQLMRASALLKEITIEGNQQQVIDQIRYEPLCYYLTIRNGLIWSAQTLTQRIMYNYFLQFFNKKARQYTKIHSKQRKVAYNISDLCAQLAAVGARFLLFFPINKVLGTDFYKDNTHTHN
jgi:hypothetical protein